MDHGDYRELFSTLANYSRMSIVQLLRRNVATVTQIAESLGYEQSRVSHSLARLQRAGIVGCRWEQKRKLFYLVEDAAPLLRQADLYLQGRKQRPNGASRHAWADGAWAAASE